MARALTRCAGSESASADSGRATSIGRFAAGAAALAVSLLAVSGASGAPAQTPKRGGTVVFNNVFAPPPCLNFLDARCLRGGPPVAYLLAREALPGAFDVGLDARPILVSQVDNTTEPPFTLTYHIRSEARWSDGVPVTASDFVFTYRVFRKHLPLGSVIGDQLATNVRSARAVGAKTVRVVLHSRIANWRRLFDLVLPRHALVGEDLGAIWRDAIVNPKTGRPIGSGPFLVARLDRSRNDPRLTYVRNPRWWGPHLAYLDRYVIWWSGLSPSAALDALRAGLLHETPLADPSTASAARRIPGVRVTPLQGPAWEHFAIRIGEGGHPALESKLVRRALAYGIDRGAIVREILREIDPSAQPSQSAIFLAQSRHYELNWARYGYRPTQARRLLDEASCPQGADGIRVCERGGRLSLRILTTAGRPNRELTLRLVQEQLRLIGVRVEPVYVPPSSLTPALQSGGFDVALFAWIRGADPDRHVDIFGCGGSLNYTGYCQRLVTRDLDQSDRILDADLQAVVLNRADAQLARDVPVIPLYQPRLLFAKRAEFRGFVYDAFDEVGRSENWWLER